MKLLNFDIMGNWLNWLVVLSMVLFGAVVIDLVGRSVNRSVVVSE